MSDAEHGKKLADPGLAVRPAPSAEEAAAIVAALRVIRRAGGDSGMNSVSGWSLAARREGLRGDLPHGRDGWKMNARLEP